MTEDFLQDAVWIAHTLFAKGSASGSSSNISFREGDQIYISGSGTCFGTLKEGQFACLTLDGEQLNTVKPSKEFPMHQMIYQYRPQIKGVIHTHSFYAALYSCMAFEDPADVIPAYTPYLRMKVGRVGLIPFAEPGSRELFSYMRERLPLSDAYLLKQHGPVVGGRTLLDAFYGIEELEESAKMAWHLEVKTRKLDYCFIDRDSL